MHYLLHISVVLAGSGRGEWLRSIGLHSATDRIWGRIDYNSAPYAGYQSFGFAFLYDISVALGGNTQAVSLRSSWTVSESSGWVCILFSHPSGVGGYGDLGFALFIMILVLNRLDQVKVSGHVP